MKIKEILNKDIFVNKDKRYKLQLIIVSCVFFLAGVVFSILNIIKGETQLLIATGVFSVLSLIVLVLSIVLKKRSYVLEILFVAASLVLFSYFLIFGGAGTHGFSTYWILLLPFLSMMVLSLIRGTIASGIMFLIIVFFLWVPFGKNLLQWKPEPEFSLRFPLVYLAALASSFLFELSRFWVDKHAENLNQQLKNAAHHDYLTTLTNRHGLQEIIQEQKKLVGTKDFRSFACMLIDVDNFKAANDNFGHAFGDKVLVSLAKILKAKCGEWAIRFGGDEFILLFANKTEFELKQIAEQIRKEAQDVRFESQPDYSFTISVGIASTKVTENYRVERIIELADFQSSRAKKHGKNLVYLVSFDEILRNSKIKNDTNLFGGGVNF